MEHRLEVRARTIDTLAMPDRKAQELRLPQRPGELMVREDATKVVQRS
jgi:hypothetical protein